MKIAFASDHAALEQRDSLIACIREMGHTVMDCGSRSSRPVDYPDYARKAILAVIEGRADEAILAAGSGIGMTILANKFPGISCALCTDPQAAEWARRHHDANIIALRCRKQSLKENLHIVKTWFSHQFSEERRFKRRIRKLMDISKTIYKGELP